MKLWIKKEEDVNNEALNGKDLFAEYKRLVNYDSNNKMFLDYDTILIADYRQAIEDDIKVILRNISKFELKGIDDKFKKRVEESYLEYKNLISINDERSDYLRAVLIDLPELTDVNSDKWWYCQFLWKS